MREAIRALTRIAQYLQDLSAPMLCVQHQWTTYWNPTIRWSRCAACGLTQGFEYLGEGPVPDEGSGKVNWFLPQEEYGP